MKRIYWSILVFTTLWQHRHKRRVPGGNVREQGKGNFQGQIVWGGCSRDKCLEGCPTLKIYLTSCLRANARLALLVLFTNCICIVNCVLFWTNKMMLMATNRFRTLSYCLILLLFYILIAGVKLMNASNASSCRLHTTFSHSQPSRFQPCPTQSQ